MKAKKGKKKGKGKKPEEEVGRYNLISLEDIMNLENRYFATLDAVRETSTKIQGIINFNKESEMEKEKEEEWAKYLKCDGLPKPDEPTQIREFIAKWEHYNDEDTMKRFSWLLDVDERSILTQDVDAVNLTKKYLRTKKKDFGDRYKNHMERTLTVLNELSDVLWSSKIENAAIYKDLLELKYVLQRTIQNTLDKFTFRVAASALGYMTVLDPQTSEYCYKCDTFQLHMWGFNDVPISFTESLFPKKEVSLDCILVHMLLPFAVLHDNLLMRGVHLNYDHYSESTKTFANPEEVPREGDLAAILKRDWVKKKQLRSKVREKLVNKRQEYDEWIRQKEEESQAKEADGKRKSLIPQAPKKKEKVKKSGKEKFDKKKFLVEPIKVDNNMFPDIDDDFNQMEQKQFQIFRESISPESLNLEEGEINFREYTLLGGIYEFNFVGKPKRTLLTNLMITWLEQPAKLKYINKNCQLKTINLHNLGIETGEGDIEREKGGADSIEDARHKKGAEDEQDDEVFHGEEQEPALTFFVITFKIPREICRWGEPIACQWYELQESREQNDSEVPSTVLKHEMITPVIINDFVLSSSMERPMVYDIINHLMPRFTSNHQFIEAIPSKSLRSVGSRRAISMDVIFEERTEEKTVAKSPAERLFPYFRPVLPIVIIPMEEGSLIKTNLWDKTFKLFSTYISELNEIKRSKYPMFKDVVQDVLEEEPIIDENPEKLDVNSSLNRKSMKPRSSSKLSKQKKQKKESENENEPQKEKKKLTFKNVAELLKYAARFRAPVQPTVEEEMSSSGDDQDDGSTVLESEAESINSKIECSDSQYTYPKWSTKNIFKSEFDKEKLELTLWTNRLGAFAFAFKRYTHLPFNEWYMVPDEQDHSKIRFYGACALVKFIIDITADGYLVQVEGYEKEKGLHVIHHAVETPLPNLKSLKKNLREVDLNIFPKRDSFVYVEKTLEKLIALEFHTYNCMALVCVFIKFFKSEWNRVTDRRTIIMKCCCTEEEHSEIEDVKITTEGCNFVHITERCTDLNQVILDYENIRWEGKFHPDLSNLIRSAFIRYIKDLPHEQLDNPKLQYNVMTFLKAVRPLSYAW